MIPLYAILLGEYPLFCLNHCDTVYSLLGGESDVPIHLKSNCVDYSNTKLAYTNSVFMCNSKTCKNIMFCVV